ncbi:exopolysaccharide biosynthesis protein BceE [Cupriavidus sp. TA19]|uniref:polysaccharide biosynthesis/export family protein n=1 Tax=unclassified Cupriavidus TaxID=2640874 RepID=UPI000E2F0955|nr:MULTISPECIES: polysaccharide biosynthesis/export family protein [unclassified Cupriavidus]BDB25614.1 polysaccharide biosynthesis/export family protein [Cupriavidus sp. P-10]GLC93892.1 exopolysaccharide biosynthesis protein BceE [Cupriavidus sp. TA19]
MSYRIVIAGLFASALAACSWAPGPALDGSRLDDNLRAKTGTQTYPVQLITADVIRAQIDAVLASNSQVSPARGTDLRTSIERYEYLVGPQDVLGVTVLFNPQLSSTAPAAPAAAQMMPTEAAQPQLPLDQNGFRVSRSGELFYPPVGVLRVGGRTIEEVRRMITRGLERDLRDPRVDVRVIAYRHGRVDVTGLVRNPGSIPVTDVPLTMINAVARTGGTMPEADVQKVRLTRGSEVYELDLEALIDRRNGFSDFLLQAGDIVNVPDRLGSRIFILGEVAKPTSMLMNRGRLTLADALAGVNSIDVRYADPRQIFIIRGMRDSPTTPEVFRLDMSQVDALLLSTQFRLEPLDVVYVGTSDAVRFNRVLEQITPTIQTLFFTKELSR